VADFTRVTAALSALQDSLGALSLAIETQAGADAALISAQGAAAQAAQDVVARDTEADAALAELVAALAEVGVSPPA
jgi:hypothetical protein